MISSLLDSLKVALSDDYNIPDSEYQKLSGIFLNKGLSEDVASTSLVSLIKVVLKHNVVFPCSIKYLTDFWKLDYSDYKFVNSLLPLVSSGIIKIVKTNEKEYQKDYILKSVNDETLNGKYLVVYSTDKLSELLSSIGEVVLPYKVKYAESVYESVEIDTLPKNIKEIILKSSKLLKDMDIKVTKESFLIDEGTGKKTINLLISKTSKYNCKDSDVLRIFKKNIKVKEVKEVEAYIEGKSELFLGLVIVDGFKPLEVANGIYLSVRELEVNYV